MAGILGACLKNEGFLDKKQNQLKQRLASLINLSKNSRMKYGYARVSTDDQKADLQTAALKKGGN